MNAPAAPFAHVAGRLLTGLVETVDLAANPEALDRGGQWAVVATFEGAVTGYRFAAAKPTSLPGARGAWPGVAGSWASSLGRGEYVAAVEAIQWRIAAGGLRQVNLCRLLSADLDGAVDHDPLALAQVLAAENPARFPAVVSAGGEWIVSASPELFLRRDGEVVTSSPIKGTARPGEPFAAKDAPENVMVTDLVRGELGQIARSVTVDALLARDELPGLAHLASTVSARLAPGIGWGEILRAMLPPASVSGVPKASARRVITQLEPGPRSVYCGAIGYVNGASAELAVAIRTFFTSGGGRRLHFGTGAGITHDSDPAAEWDETELKASRLIALAAGAS